MGTIISASDLTVSQIQTGVVIVDQDTKDYANNTIEWQVLGKDQDGNGTITIQTKTAVGDGAEGYGTAVGDRRYDPLRNKLDSELQVWLDTTFYNHIGANLKAAIIPTTKAITPYQSGDISSRECKLFSLSVAEVGGYDLSGSAPEYYTPESNAFTYQYYQGIESTGNNSKRVHTGGTQSQWWLRSPTTSLSSGLWNVSSTGYIFSTSTSDFAYYSPSPACVLPSSIQLEEVTVGKYNIVWGDSGNEYLDKDGTEHLIGLIKSGKEDKFRFSTMPTASADWLGKTVEYTGTTTQTYTHSKRYECQVVPESDPTAYEWVAEASSTTDSRIGDEVTKIGVRLGGGLRPYIMVDVADVIPSFSTASIEDISFVLDMYYNGILSLADIQSVWHLGDYTTFTMNAMEAYEGCEAHAQQSVSMMIVDFDHDTLATPISGKTKSLLTLHMKDCFDEKGFIHQSTSGGYSYWYDTSVRKDWCDEVCYEAFPNSVKSIIKTVVKDIDSGSYTEFTQINTNVFIPSFLEMGGDPQTENVALEGSLYPYYQTQSNRIKKVNDSAYQYWTRSKMLNDFADVKTNGQISKTDDGRSALEGIAVAICI